MSKWYFLLPVLFMIYNLNICKAQISYFYSYENTTHFNSFNFGQHNEFATTLKGAGSIGWDEAIHIINYKKNKFSVMLGAGYRLRSYRFTENLQLTKTAQNIQSSLVSNPIYEYNPSFFGWSKTKMVVGSYYLPLIFDIDLGFGSIRCKVAYSRYSAGKFKIKYIEDGAPEFSNTGTVFMGFIMDDNKRKHKISNKDFRDYYINKNMLSLYLEFVIGKNDYDRFSIGYSYDVFPFFQEGKGPQIHGVSIYFSEINKIPFRN